MNVAVVKHYPLVYCNNDSLNIHSSTYEGKDDTPCHLSPHIRTPWLPLSLLVWHTPEVESQDDSLVTTHILEYCTLHLQKSPDLSMNASLSNNFTLNFSSCKNFLRLIRGTTLASYVFWLTCLHFCRKDDTLSWHKTITAGPYIAGGGGGQGVQSFFLSNIVFDFAGLFLVGI